MPVASLLPLAQQGGGQGSLFGWYLGFVIGFVVVVVVVVIVAAILNLASKISDQARDASAALDAGQVNTLPLWDVSATNRISQAILRGARAARRAVEG